ncbi:uncharacterized protein E0L32_005782 [Thyridium curvatum]|uniref:F-box domain-containing protein n=1 Tax=Thyridium curvatum TaxID=1093900 RepID=A0A507BAM0_9PEZI|nr:uncharacterized protein E0L32_005782 [Thyridium curvatum]TPX13838.1 hypothetical protein E0L32_005782 [Thyridium curvatum]
MAESNNHFDLLPVEVIEIIFGFLPDIASLRAAAITSKRLLAVTRGAKTMLITQVVVNHISPELMPEAWLALESERLRPNSIEQVDQFAETHFRNREANSRLITLAEGMAMERRHAAVEYFTAKCSNDAQQYLPFLGKLSEEHYGRSFPEYKTNLVADMTKTEHDRFARAFYLIEVCYKLLGFIYTPLLYGQDYGANGSSFLPMAKKSFTGWFSHSELEQMAVAHGYLYGLIETICEYQVSLVYHQCH